VNVAPTTWAALNAASSAVSYHYDSIRLEYPYVDITNFHTRLPEGPAPESEDVPEGVPSILSASVGGRDFSDRRKTPQGVPEDAHHIDDESECDGTVHEGPQGGLYCSPDDADEGGGGDSADPFDDSPDQVFDDITSSEDMAKTVENLTTTWTGWPTDSDAAPMWQAAEELTGNDNDPGDITGTPLTEQDVDEADVEAYQEYKSNLEDRLREKHGDEITAHRFMHSEAADALQEGESLQPRTLGSWTTDKDQIPDLVDSIPTPDGDFADPDEAVVVSMDIPVEDVFDHHAANPELDDANQNEVLVGAEPGTDLSTGDVQVVSEIEAAVIMQKQDEPSEYPNILLGYDFEPPEGKEESTQSLARRLLNRLR
jgi:hypothetical protein